MQEGTKKYNDLQRKRTHKQPDTNDDDPNRQVLLVCQDLFVGVLGPYHHGRPSSQDVYQPAVTERCY